MPGRRKGMLKKTAELETMALALYRHLAAVTPLAHKEPEPSHGVSATPSPWVAVHRIGCEFLLAVVELGDHARKAAKSTEAGPIRSHFDDPALRRLREKYQRGGNGRTHAEMARLHAAANRIRAQLPIDSDPIKEANWALCCFTTQLRTLKMLRAKVRSDCGSLWNMTVGVSDSECGSSYGSHVIALKAAGNRRRSKDAIR